MQIALKLGVSRDTVRRYQRMSEKEFEGIISNEVLRRKRKLEAFEGFIKQLLQDAPFLSAAQIYDRLKEHYPDLPYVSERTVYNTVRLVREREDLPKIQEPTRQMSKVADCDYGEKAQVDFGEKWMRNTKGKQVKVHLYPSLLKGKLTLTGKGTKRGSLQTLALEVLGSVDFIRHINPGISLDDTIKAIHNWSDRKTKLFKNEYIQIAYDHRKHPMKCIL